MISFLPHLDALLNALAATLLVIGFLLIKRGRRIAHRNVMLCAFGVSVLFLTCYLVHQTANGPKLFPRSAPVGVRYAYFVLLASHVVLAAATPVLAIGTIWLGLTERWERHRAWARWTFPIWLYVSVTGVVVYLMLYQLYPAAPD